MQPESTEHPTVLLHFLNAMNNWEVIMNEIFKTIPNYNGGYQVSNLGNVKSFKKYGGITERILSTSSESQGYLVVSLYLKGKKKTFHIHKLIQSAFELGEGNIDHINGIRNDNRLSNLRVVTTRENNQNLECHRNGKLVGANFDKRMSNSPRPWRAQIKINGKCSNLGAYATEAEANKAYMEKVRQLDEIK
jgi:hypothetical protein